MSKKTKKPVTTQHFTTLTEPMKLAGLVNRGNRDFPVIALIHFYEMDLDNLGLRSQFDAMVEVEYKRRVIALEKELGEENLKDFSYRFIREAVKGELMLRFFPPTARVMAMREAAPYLHSRMPALRPSDLPEDKKSVGDRIARAQERLANAVEKSVTMPVQQLIEAEHDSAETEEPENDRPDAG